LVIALYTDFGVVDPYVGQMHAVLAREAPGVPIVDLFHAVPVFDIRAAAYLLPAFAAEFPEGTIFVCVVDPGVGGDRHAVIVHADGHWYVGPDNGLFHIVARRSTHVETRIIQWRPERLSSSFHGRDLFAPVAARLTRGDWSTSIPGDLETPLGDWPEDWPAIIYVDHFGNAVTGLRACSLDHGASLAIGGQRLRYAPTFSAVALGQPFWYENANGLVEIAANQGNAARLLDLRLGMDVSVLDD